MPNHNKHPNQNEKKAFAHAEHMQFSDGTLVEGFRTPGDLIQWNMHSTTNGIEQGSPGYVLIGTKTGKRFVMGEGVVVMLPEDGVTPEGKSPSGDKTVAVVAKSVIDRLPDLTIGESWEGVEDEEVSDIAIETKVGPLLDWAVQVDAPSPFKGPKKLLRAAVKKMKETDQWLPN